MDRLDSSLIGDSSKAVDRLISEDRGIFSRFMNTTQRRGHPFSLSLWNIASHALVCCDEGLSGRLIFVRHADI
jgi:hypothetical protein